MADSEAYPFLDGAGAPTPYAPARDGQAVIYRGVRLIDGRGGPTREGMAVVTDGMRIRAVEPAAGCGPDRHPGAEVVDLDGTYLIPGLIDSHQHVATPPDRRVAEAVLERQVYSGVTAIRDMADDLRQVSDLARATMTGEIAGPDIVYAAFMAGPTFFDDPRTAQASSGYRPGTAPWMQAVDASTDMTAAVAAARGSGAAAIKAYADLDAATIGRIVAEAHRQGLRVWAHAVVPPTGAAEVAAAGVDGVSHAELLVFHTYGACPSGYRDFREHRPPAYRRFLAAPDDALDGLLATMRRRRVVLDATVSMFERGLAATDADTAAARDRAVGRIVARARRVGVTLSAGTDYETPLADPYPSLLAEIACLAGRHGLTPDEALAAATVGGARALGMLDTMGTVEVGKLANLVALRDDPRTSVDHLRSVILTVRRGRRYARTAYAAHHATGGGEGGVPR